MIVVDASVLPNAFIDDGPLGTRARAELAGDTHSAAPALVALEVFSAVRGRRLGQKITQQRAEDALRAMATAAVDLVATTPLLTRMCELRSNATGCDAAFIAVTETFHCPLVTADSRIARVPGPRRAIRLALPRS